MPRTAARKEYTLFVMCDSWIGADQLVPLKLKVRRKKTMRDCCPDWRGSSGATAVPLIARIPNSSRSHCQDPNSSRLVARHGS